MFLKIGGFLYFEGDNHLTGTELLKRLEMKHHTPWLSIAFLSVTCTILMAKPIDKAILTSEELLCWLNQERTMNIDTPEARPAVYRYIRTNEYMTELELMYSTDRKAQYELKKWLKDQAKAALKLDGVTIPVVFHILYAKDTDKISEDQVMSQLDALNRDFNSLRETDGGTKENEEAYRKEKFDKLKGSIDIQFCLATQKKNDEILKGIQYYEVEADDWNYDGSIQNQERGGVASWDPDLYLNIWVGRLTDSVSGYAQMPGLHRESDGIVIDHRYLGTRGTVQAPYDEGKTLTHLVANYLGVPSLWTLRPCGDDGIEDTPVHNAPNFGCPGYKHVSMCFRNPSELTMNFLDNTDDACMYMFTQQQVHLMYAALSDGGPRYDLWKHGGQSCEEQDISPPPLENKPPGNESYLTVYPNPATTYLVLESGQVDNNETLQVSIRDVMGREVWHRQDMKANTLVEISCVDWNRGVYFVIINNQVDQPYQKILLP